MKKLSNAEFIERAKKMHGDKYDYSKVSYVNEKTKVCIICPEHGEFWQKPEIHLMGCGCHMCKSENIKISKTTSFSEFVEKANKVHKGKYVYHKDTYSKVANKTKITCPIHGDFWQEARSHLNGFGCKKCSHLYMDKEVFVTKANIIHNNKYDYSKVEYVNAKTKVCIICPEHREFWQSPEKHISRKQGCPMCSQSHLEEETMCFLIENNIKYEYQKKFEWLGKQSLDFYLPDYNLGIECQGIQHFEPIDFANKGPEWSKNNFEKIKIFDKLKKEKSKENNVNIEYVDYKDNVKNKLLIILKKYDN